MDGRDMRHSLPPWRFFAAFLEIHQAFFSKPRQRTAAAAKKAAALTKGPAEPRERLNLRPVMPVLGFRPNCDPLAALRPQLGLDGSGHSFGHVVDGAVAVDDDPTRL